MPANLQAAQRKSTAGPCPIRLTQAQLAYEDGVDDGAEGRFEEPRRPLRKERMGSISLMVLYGLQST